MLFAYVTGNGAISSPPPRLLPLLATRQTPHGASRLVQAMSGWSAKTRRAPSRHFRGARVYGHTTTAMHDREHTPPSRTREDYKAQGGHLVIPALGGYNGFATRASSDGGHKSPNVGQNDHDLDHLHHLVPNPPL